MHIYILHIKSEAHRLHNRQRNAQGSNFEALAQCLGKINSYSHITGVQKTTYYYSMSR